MKNPDQISECLETIFWKQILKFYEADPESKKNRIRDKHPGSATLLQSTDIMCVDLEQLPLFQELCVGEADAVDSLQRLRLTVTLPVCGRVLKAGTTFHCTEEKKE